jgi:hypothetical protein
MVKLENKPETPQYDCFIPVRGKSMVLVLSLLFACKYFSWLDAINYWVKNYFLEHPYTHLHFVFNFIFCLYRTWLSTRCCTYSVPTMSISDQTGTCLHDTEIYNFTILLTRWLGTVNPTNLNHLCSCLFCTWVELNIKKMCTQHLLTKGKQVCSVPIGLIFYRERASQPAKNETKEKRWKEEKETLN